MKPRYPTRPQRQRGLSIIELMVGMVMGLLAMLVILQMYQVFEGHKRTTTTGGDAQENGLYALTTLERDAKMAGYGLTNAQTLGCATVNTWIETDNTSGGAPIPDFSTAPITIIDGGASPDSIIIRTSSSLLGGAPTSIRSNMPQPSSELNVSSTMGFAQDDLIIAVQGGNCTLMQVTQVQESALKLQRNPGGNPSPSDPNYNPPANCYNAGNACAAWPTYTAGALIYNLGNIFIKTYSISTLNALQVGENGAAAIAVADQIVDFQAQYGVADTGSQVVNSWVDATDTWAAPSATDIKRIKAVRIAIVARSTQYEKTEVSPNALTLWPSGPSLSLTADQRHYRYKVYQTIVPIKNMLWANV